MILTKRWAISIGSASIIFMNVNICYIILLLSPVLIYPLFHIYPLSLSLKSVAYSLLQIQDFVLIVQSWWGSLCIHISRMECLVVPDMCPFKGSIFSHRADTFTSRSVYCPRSCWKYRYEHLEPTDRSFAL